MFLSLTTSTDFRIISDDFEDGNIDKWAIISDDIDDFFIDIQQRTLYNGETTKALRIAEAGVDTAAEIQLTTLFTLEEGESYQLTFWGMADARGQEWASDDFHPITPVVWNAANAVLEYYPEIQGGLPMGSNWYRFRTTFDVGAGFGGNYVFSFVVNSSGKQLDWYFDNIIIETLP